MNALEVAIRQRIEELGNNFAKQDNWTDFDDHIAGTIVCRVFEGVNKRIRNELDDWREKLKDFEEENINEIGTTIEVLQDSVKDISRACATNSHLAHAAVIINNAMKTGEKFGIGALAGGATSLATMGNTMFSLSGITALANPLTLTITATALALYGAIRFFTNSPKIKEKFLEKKVEQCRIILDEKTNEIIEDLKKTADQIKAAFLKKAEKQYAPIIRKIRMLVLYNQLYLEVIDKTHSSLDLYVGEIRQNLAEMKAL